MNFPLVIAPDLSVEPDAVPRGADRRPTLAHYVAFSFLVHVLVIVWVGSEAGGGARRAEPVWGPLRVTLRDAPGKSPPGLVLVPSAEKPAAPAPLTTTPPARPATRDIPTALRAVPAPRTPTVATEPKPSLQVDAPAPSVSPQVVTPIKTLEMPAPQTAPIEHVAPRAPEREPAAPVETKPAAPPPLEPAPPAERATPAPTPTPTPTPTAAKPMAAPVQAPIEPLPAPPVEPPPAPTPPVREIVPPPPPRVDPVEPPPKPSVTPQPAPTPTAAPTADRAPQSPSSPRDTAPSATAPAQTTAPTPNQPPNQTPTVTLGRDPPTAAAPAASEPPLNLQLASPHGRDLIGRRMPGVLPLLPPPPERKSKLAEGIEKSTRAGCQTAYGSMGLLAVLPLAVDAVKGDGCKW